MNTANPPKAAFDQRYQTHLKHLKLKGLQPKTIDAYSRAIRRMGDYFDFQIDNLSAAQLTDYFSDLIASHSWSAVKLDLYGFKFYTLHVLGNTTSLVGFCLFLLTAAANGRPRCPPAIRQSRTTLRMPRLVRAALPFDSTQRPHPHGRATCRKPRTPQAPTPTD